ncbi:hypothetical protein [Lactiplantibacillus plantarum]|nr:hypothetical protein LP80_1861 [Lactiplantibacillus plantarum]
MGPLGTVRAQSHLRQVLDSPGVGMQILPGNEFLLSAVQDKMNADGDLTDNKVVEWLDHCVADYLKFAHQLAAND